MPTRPFDHGCFASHSDRVIAVLALRGVERAFSLCPRVLDGEDVGAAREVRRPLAQLEARLLVASRTRLWPGASGTKRPRRA